MNRRPSALHEAHEAIDTLNEHWRILREQNLAGDRRHVIRLRADAARLGRIFWRLGGRKGRPPRSEVG